MERKILTSGWFHRCNYYNNCNHRRHVGRADHSTIFVNLTVKVSFCYNIWYLPQQTLINLSMKQIVLNIKT